MDSAPVERTATPLPSIPRVIGTLNLVIGSFLLLLGWYWLGAVGPSIVENRPFKLDPGDAQNLYNQVHKELLAAYEARELTAKDEAEKGRMKRERLALAGDYREDVDRTLDVAVVNRHLLWTSWYLWADTLTGPILNLLMLASGIGLTQMKEWARVMGIWVAALKIVRLVALTALLFVVVIPHTYAAMERVATTKLGEVLIAKLNFKNVLFYDGKPPLPPVTAQEFVSQMSGISYVLAFLMLVFGSIYPLVALVLLSLPGTRAACAIAEEAEAE